MFCSLTSNSILLDTMNKLEKLTACPEHPLGSICAIQVSEFRIQKVQKPKNNTSKKVYHHTLGQGGYKLTKSKWDKMEQDLLDRGITHATINWPERSRT